MIAPAPRVRVEPHGPDRVLVMITRSEPRAFQLSHAEAAWLAGELARYLGELPEAERATLSGPLRAAGVPTTREHAPGRGRQRGAQRAAPAPGSSEARRGRP
jgi:hypothetical protein